MDTKIGIRSSSRPAGRLVRPAGLLLAALGLAAAGPAYAKDIGSAPFEQAEGASPRWTDNSAAALNLIELLETSTIDGVRFDPDRLRRLRNSLDDLRGGNSNDAARANRRFNQALVDYVTQLRTPPLDEWIINDRAAIPRPPAASELLSQAAAAPSLDSWLAAMPFMHPTYAKVRAELLAARDRGDRQAEEVLAINLQRLRLLPATGRYILVNIAAQTLEMHEGGQLVDRMKVVVGKPHQPTPMMAATIKFTALNPYWHVPSDLAAERVAPNVVKQGIGYLKEQGYVLLSDWGEQAKPVDPAEVDWQAVADGRVLVRLRQNPGPGNAMGRMKFMFPNPQGIYLHDTPNKELLSEEARMFSGGCVRLEDAGRLARWLYGRRLNWRGAAVEQEVPLEQPVPVYLAYLTAVAEGDKIVRYDDIYGKDRALLAGSGPTPTAAR